LDAGLDIAAAIMVGLVAVLHVYILVLEMFLWRTPRVRAIFGTTAEVAESSAPLAANQGLYNGFLAAGLVFGLVEGGPDGTVGFPVTVFFTACVVVAGVYGAVTANPRILIVQALPGAVALGLTLLAH
jgi:putative membrane protein